MNLNLTRMTLTIGMLFEFIANATVAPKDAPKQSLNSVQQNPPQNNRETINQLLILYEKTKNPQCLKTIGTITKAEEATVQESIKKDACLLKWTMIGMFMAIIIHITIKKMGNTPRSLSIVNPTFTNCTQNYTT